MSQFFRQLIDLGEEQAGGEAASSEDLTKLTATELLAHIQKLDARILEQRHEYDKLQGDSLSLRSEYDAYKKKVDGWQRQMKEARAADKKMIEELRAAGSSGKMDDVFMKTTNETIQALKENLRDAQEEMQKSYKRQREAEESRVAAEHSKKQELEALGSKFDAFKERSKTYQDRLEAQLEAFRSSSKDGGTTSSGVQQLKQQLDASERQRHALQRRLEALGSNKEATDVAAAVEPSDGAAQGTASASASEAAALLQEEVAQLNSQLLVASAKEAELLDRLRKADEKLQRQAEDAQWESLEAGKRLAESKTEVDMLKTRVTQLESKLDAKDEEHALNEKQSRRVARDLEDALALEKERHASDVRELHQQRMQLEQQLQLESEKLAHNSELVGEAENATRKTSESLEAQRKHFEKMLREKDVVIQQLHSVRESLEIGLQESKEDARHHTDVFEELKRELDQSSERITELEHQQLIGQRALNAREEDVQSRESERQKLRAHLRQEEDTNAKLRSVVTQLETRLTEMELELRRKDSTLHDAVSARDMAQSDLQLSNSSIADLQKALKSQEARVQELTARIQDQGVRNSDIVRLREDQLAQIRKHEHRIAELEQELMQSRPSDSGTASAHRHAGNAGMMASAGSAVVDVVDHLKHVSPAAIKKQFVTDAMAMVKQQKFLSVSNYRQLLMIAVGMFLLLSMFSGFHTAQQTSSLTDSESINNLREKYGQALVATGTCREMLNAAKEQIASLCACPPK